MLHHGGNCDFLPPPAVAYTTPRLEIGGAQYRFACDEPKLALASLEKIFIAGNLKHGELDWKKHQYAEFLEKAQRHYLKRILGERIDESGEPHLIHAAANLLLAAELENVWFRVTGVRNKK